MKIKELFTLVFLLSLVPEIHAHQPDIRNFASSHYGGGTQNCCISQSDDKRMLFANNNGLLAFDSENWFLFPMANHTIVRSILYNKANNIIYAGASNEFGYFQIDPVTYLPVYKSLSSRLPATDKYFEEIWNIVEYNGCIIFQAKTRVFVLRPDGKFRIFRIGYRIECSAVVQGKYIVACKEKTYCLTGNKLREMPNTKAMANTSVRAILPYSKNCILFATASNGVYIYDGKAVKPFPLDITPYLKENQIFCAAVHKNLIAFGTVRGGLVVKNTTNGKNIYVNLATGMQNNTVLSVYFDERSNIWLGLDQGISYILMDAPNKDFFTNNSQIGSGYASLIHNSLLYLGTNQGLFVTPYPVIDSPSPATPKIVSNLSGQVWCIRNIEGSLLCGNNDGSYEINGLKARRIAGPEGTWDFKPLQRHPGYVLSCDYKGLFILKKTGGSWRFSNRVNGFSEISSSFEEDPDGSIWISHWQKGIFHLWLDPTLHRVTREEKYDSRHTLSTDDNNLISKINGQIYVSGINGIFHYDHRTHQLVSDTRLTRIFHGIANPIRFLQTPKRDIWAVYPKGLAIARIQKNGRYLVDSSSFRNIARSIQTGLGHVCFVDSNNTIFNAGMGFLLVNNFYKATHSNTRLFIRRILSTSSRDTVLYSNSTATRHNSIVVPHSLNSIKLEYVWPEYMSDGAVTYSCKLEKYDLRWSNPQPLLSKEYTHLGKGTYTFRVRGYNMENGLTQETSIVVTILPAWYETWYAYLLYALLLALAAFAVAKYIRFRYNLKLHIIERRRQRELKEQQALFEIETQKKEKEVIRLKNEQLEIDLKHKSSELADSTMNLIRKNDMLQSLDDELDELTDDVRREAARHLITSKIRDIRQNIHSNIKEDENWEKFEENFNLVYDNYMQKLCLQFPDLKLNDRKLCAYLRMGLSSKEMASLLNTSVRSIETARYRLRKKLELGHDNNLTGFIQSLQ